MALPWAFQPPPSGDASDLLDFDVDQVTGLVVLVADRGDLQGADLLACDRVALPQVRDPCPAQDP